MDVNKKKEILDKIINESLDKVMSERFGRYAKYVIQQRALPDIKDGLKPVQRRILYAMYDLGLSHDKPYKKSARVVGDVIGKYHPHGDSSVYEAMVNMSQPWKSNIPLLDMHGNIGSIDNDPAAAMRYTEVRLSKVTEFILNDLKKNTVAFIPNFDDSEKEPVVLPSIFPTLLVNGAKGIAVGMATDLPPHNLSEVIDATIAKIKKPNISLKEIRKYILGPDFPTGGIIKGIKGIDDAFEFGNNIKDKIHLYAKCNLYSKSSNKFIEITEIPYGVSKSSLVYEIDMLINKGAIDGVLEIKDQSDRNGINILITMDVGVNEHSVLSYLYQKTQLKITYSYNNTVIKNNQPMQLNLMQMLDSYEQQVRDIKTKTLNYDLQKNLLRLEIVLGFIKVSEITDKVIKVIRESEDSKSGVIKDLIKHFAFSEIQATAIAELRLYRLSKTDKQAYLKEKNDLENEINYIKELLDDSQKFNKFIIEILLDIKKQFGAERKTKIENEHFDFNHKETDLIKEEEVYILVSKNGYIKRFNEKTYISNNLSNSYIKEDDAIMHVSKMNTMHNLVLFTNFGNYAILPIHKIAENKWKEHGTYVRDLYDFKIDEQIISVLEIKNWESDLYIITGTKNGFFKHTKLIDFKAQRSLKSYTAMTLIDNDVMIGAKLSNNHNNLLILTNNSLISYYPETDISTYGTKAKGIKGVYLSLNDKVTDFILNKENIDLVFVSDKGYWAKLASKKIQQVSRNTKGKKYSEINQLNKITAIIQSNNMEILVKTDSYNLVIEKINNLKDKQGSLQYPVINKLFVNDIQKEFQLNPLSDFSVESIKENSKNIEKSENLLKEKEKQFDDILAKVEKLLNLKK
ncbi:topoisomerase-4 subunit A [Mycoplasmopsis mustelae]|uniref:DNA topoisomerase (ATP-hydrolyzing) n=1 Tax=Mycoplasmopsis mustelae TaxID=171289 RepID=A0A4R7UCE2_9BACT|nr:DNA topoisomerase (ATP-hydrolyzing) [Mycoplasmopsis mustelae]TDV23558.1 topoisomerase-4 subunit A [Mycoplasmopsis mustelae]